MPNTSSRRFQRVRRGTGYPGPMRRECVLAIFVALAGCGWRWFGPNSVGTAILATPLLIAVSLLIVAIAGLSGALVASGLVGASPFVLHLGPRQVRWATRDFRIRIQCQTGWFGGMLLPTMRPGKHDSAPEATAALGRGMAFASLAIASFALVLLYLCTRTPFDPSPTWGAYLLTAASFVQIVRSASAIGGRNRLQANSLARKRISAAHAVNAGIRDGRRPATCSIDLIDELADPDSGALPAIAEMHYLAYYALLKNARRPLKQIGGVPLSSFLP